MEFIVLGLLTFGDMTIYELNAAFRQGLSLIYAASYGNLQYAVKKLLKSGYIDFREYVEKGRNKKVYSLKESGRLEFFRWMEKEISTTRLETVMLSKIYFLGLINDKNLRIQIVEDIVQKAEQAEGQLLRLRDGIDLSALPADLQTVAEYQLKTLDYGITAHSAGKTWLYRLLDDIKTENAASFQP